MEMDLDEVVGTQLAFINFDRELILTDYCKALPKQRVVLELSDTIEIHEEDKRCMISRGHVIIDIAACADQFQIRTIVHRRVPDDVTRTRDE